MIKVPNFRDHTVAVFGLARSGLAAVRALQMGGAIVEAWDDNPASRDSARAAGVPLVDLRSADWGEYSALVLAPGVPLTHPAPHWTVERAREEGIDVIGDVELFALAVRVAPGHRRPKVVAITGTNGKSTTTALIGHMLSQAGRDARIGGNIGVPVLGLEPMHGGAIYVLELSSYQLDLTRSLKPDVAILLNITPDHLDRHGGMDGYIAAKRRILLGQGKGDTAIIGVDEEPGARICTEITAANRRTIVPVSVRKAVSRGVYALGGKLYDARTEPAIELADLPQARSLPGRHNAQNAAAAYAAGRALGLTAREAVRGLMTFGGLAHRMETIGRIGQVRFVNDSKATNVDAARQAMSSYPKFRWIAGGRAKEGGIDCLADLFPRVTKAYLIGEAASDFAYTLKGRAEAVVSGTLDAAAAAAFADAKRSGDEEVVVFSPACASFDQFTDFEARGEAFRAAVHALAPENATSEPLQEVS